MSTQKKRAKEIKKKFDILQGGSENKCKAVPYNNKEKKIWIWPENDGCADIYKIKTLPKGTIVDRFGLPYGNFVSMPETSYVERSLPYMMNSNECRREYDNKEVLNNYHQYEIINKNGIKVKECIIAPAFDKPGGVKNKRKQYRFNQSVYQLLESDELCELPRIDQVEYEHPYYCKNKKMSNYPLFK